MPHVTKNDAPRPQLVSRRMAASESIPRPECADMSTRSERTVRRAARAPHLPVRNAEAGYHAQPRGRQGDTTVRVAHAETRVIVVVVGAAALGTVFGRVRRHEWHHRAFAFGGTSDIPDMPLVHYIGAARDQAGRRAAHPFPASSRRPAPHMIERSVPRRAESLPRYGDQRFVYEFWFFHGACGTIGGKYQPPPRRAHVRSESVQSSGRGSAAQ